MDGSVAFGAEDVVGGLEAHWAAFVAVFPHWEEESGEWSAFFG